MNNLTVVKKIYYYLGGAENINDISHCLSRLRITVQRPAKTADDAKFLALKARGVVREKKQIHIIFNNLSHILSPLLKDITETMRDELSRQIVILAQGQIHAFDFHENLLVLKLSKEITLDSSAVSLLQKQGVSVLSKPLQLELTLSEYIDTDRINKMLFLWDLIVASEISKQLDQTSIKKISYTQGMCRIKFTNLPNIKQKQWEHLGIPEIHAIEEEEEEEIQFLFPSESLSENLRTIHETIK